MTNRIDTAAWRARLATLEGHTPGPWRKHGNGRHVTSDTDLVALAVAGPIKHNTRLITVAPDLKATLATALDEIEGLRAALVRMVDELSCDDPDCDICAPARAALRSTREDSK